MSNFKQKCKDEKGEVMLESTIIFLLTMFILIAMISVGFLFYQKAMLNTIATEMATKVGNDYKLALGEDGETELENIKLYRTTFALSSMEAMHKENIETVLPERVELTSLGFGDEEPKVENFDISVDNVGRMHVEITISMECKILFGGALEYFGILDDTPKLTSTARAECLDVTAYCGHVQFLDYVERKVNDDGGAISDIMNSVVDIINNATSIKDILIN